MKGFLILRIPGRWVLPLIFSVPAFWGSSQSFYRQGTSVERAGKTPVEAGGYLFVSCTAMELPHAGASYLYRYDASGNSVRYAYGKYIWNMIATFQGDVLVLAQEKRCSLQPDTLSYFLERIDTGGQVTASVPLEKGAGPVVQQADSGYLAFLWDNKTLVRFDKDLNQVSKVTHTLGPVQGAVRCKNGMVAVSHLSAAGNRVSLLDATGATVSSKTVAVPIPELHLLGTDRLIGYAAGAFYVFDYSLTLVQAKSFSKYVYDYFTSGDTIYAVMQDSLPSDLCYGVMKSSFNVIYKAAISLYAPSALCGYGNSVALLWDPKGLLSFGWTGHCLSVRPKHAGLNLGKNLAVTGFVVDSAYVVPGSQGQYGMHATLNYTVGNWGAPVDKFSVTFELDPGAVCGRYYHTEEIKQPLAFGESYSGSVHGLFRRASPLNAGVVTGTFCIAAFGPDGEFDSQPADNLQCRFPSIDPLAVSAQAGLPGLTLFPNPASGEMRFVSRTRVDKLMLLTVDGCVLGSWEPGSLNGAVDLSAYAPGLYLLRVTAANGSAVRKVVKAP